MRRRSAYSLLRICVVLVFLVLVGRLWYMQIVQVDAYRATATQRATTIRTLYASRGVIYDSRGRPLVRNLPRLEVTVVPAQWRSGERESRLLSRLLHYHPSAARIRWLIRHQVRLSNGVTTSPAIIRGPVSYRTFLLIEANANRLPGVVAGAISDRRYYLESAPFPLAHVIGYTGVGSTPGDTIGRSGLEDAYERYLHGSNGFEAARINAAGDQVTPWHIAVKPKPGDGLKLTINSAFESDVASDVRAAMKKNGWKYGSAVAMNPYNGHILALVSLPSFDANAMTDPDGTRRTRSYDALLKNPLHPFVDNSVDGVYPPGSIYKVITATAGLATHVIRPNTIVDDTGQLERYPGAQIFHGWYGPGLGPVSVVRAIAESSDIFFYQVAGGGPDIHGYGLGPARLGRWARRFGLGEHSGIEVPDATGLVPSRAKLATTQHRTWSWGDSYNMGIGQGDNLVTPLQMARVASVIANGGTLVRPTLIQGLTGPDGHRILPGKDFGAVPDVVRKHFVPAWIAHLIGYGMRLGVEMHGVYPQWGTSYGEVDQRTEAAGKTGTAQTFVPGTNPPVPTTNAWWLGYAPYNHPKIAVAVVFPYSDTEGAFGAAPVASKIILDFEHKKAASDWLSKVITDLAVYN